TLLSIFALALAHVIAVDTTGHNFSTSKTPVTGRTISSIEKRRERSKAFYAAWSGMNLGRMITKNNPSSTSWSDGPYYIDSPGLMGEYRVTASLTSVNSDPAHTLANELQVKSLGRKIKWPYEITSDYLIGERYRRSSCAYVSDYGGLVNYVPVRAIDTTDSNPLYEGGLDKDMGRRGSPTCSGQVGVCNIKLGNRTWVRDVGSGQFLIIDFWRNETINEIRFLNERKPNGIQQMTVYTWDAGTGSWVSQGTQTFPVGWVSNPAAPEELPFADFDSGRSCAHPNVYRGDRCSDFLDKDNNGNVWSNLYKNGYGSVTDPCIFDLGFTYHCWPETSDYSYIARFPLAAPVTTSKVKMVLVFDPTNTSYMVKELNIYNGGTNVLKANHGIVRVYHGDPLVYGDRGGTQNAGTVFTEPTTYP
ncbi:MAG: hypothetical protein ABH845_00995, partial [Candidatus Omnitrophota bacterium]